MFLFLAIAGSIGSGISIPIMSYLTSDTYSDLGNTSEIRDTQANIQEMKRRVKKQ